MALEEFEKVIESDALARKPGHKHGSLLDEDLASVVEDGNGLQRVPANPTDHLRLPVNVVAIDLDDLKFFLAWSVSSSKKRSSEYSWPSPVSPQYLFSNTVSSHSKEKGIQPIP